MSAASLMIWGLVAHLICDWLFQSDWMAQNKMKRRRRFIKCDCDVIVDSLDGPWWDRHPAAYVHSGIHLLGLLLVFPWYAALAVAASHFFIDLRWPVEKWSKLMRQTQPRPIVKNVSEGWYQADNNVVLVDMGTEVRIWTDQVFHIACLAVAALVVAA